MQRWIIALAVFMSLAPPALAGGIHGRIEGPDRDGLTYTARTYSCEPNATLEPWGYAEGVVDGKRQSWLLRLKPTGEHGVYRFTRTWPRQGHWMIRLSLGHPPAPATVATLRGNGTVQSNDLYLNSDGTQECQKALHRFVKRTPGSDDDC